MTINPFEQTEPAILESFPKKLWSRRSGWIILVLFLILFFGLSFGSAYLIPENSDPFLMTAMALLSNVIACYGSVLLINFFFEKHNLKEIGFVKTTLLWVGIAVFFAFFMIIARVILATVIILLFPFMDVGAEALQEVFIENNSNILTQLITLLIGGVIAPIGEELFFRGFLHNWLRNRLKMWPAILLSSFIFSAFHIIPLQALMAFPVGILTAWLYEKSKSLTAPILVHVTNNTFAFTVAILASYFLPELMQ